MSYRSSNSLTREQQDYYFSHQLAAMEREYKDVLARTIASNHSKRNLFIGEIIGFDEKRGNLLVRILGVVYQDSILLMLEVYSKVPPKVLI